MKLKRSYEITPLTIGHSMYSATETRYEIVIKEGEDYALIYQDIYPYEDITSTLENLEELSWRTLDALTWFWNSYANLFPLPICDEYSAKLSAIMQATLTFRNF